MREILFRGKRLDNGEWVEGIAFPHDGAQCSILYQHPADGSLAGTEVDPATVGQLTGLTDKNGKKIFEGDVVLEKHTGYKAVVEWQSDTCRFLAIIANRRSERSPHFFYVDKGSDRGSQMSSNEIIGNIHDNPELMEDKQ